MKVRVRKKLPDARRVRVPATPRSETSSSTLTFSSLSIVLFGQGFGNKAHGEACSREAWKDFPKVVYTHALGFTRNRG